MLQREHSAILLTFNNAGQEYCRMLQREHSSILSTFIKLSVVFKTFVLSIFEWPFQTDFTAIQVSKGAKIRSRYNQVPHLTQDTNGKVTNSQLDTTNQSQEVSPFPAGDHKAHINRRAQRHSKHKTNKNIKDPQKKYRLGTVSKIFYWRA